MATRIFTIIASLLTSFFLVACSKDQQPSTSEIEHALTSTLPAFARVSSFSVAAMQIMGTQVEPVWQSRFRAVVKVTTATFAPDGTDPGVVFVRAIKQAGETTEVFGKSVSTLYAGKWRTALDLEGQPIQALGQPESAFGPQKVIVRGSKAETAYLAEQSERRRLAILAAEKEAEEQRLADERASQEKQKRLRAELQALETADCVEGEQRVPSKSQRVFVVNPKRVCWTPWLILEGWGSFDLKVREGNILEQIVFRDGTVGDPFEDGPTKSFNLGMRAVEKMRFKSLGKEPVTITFSVK